VTEKEDDSRAVC